MPKQFHGWEEERRGSFAGACLLQYVAVIVVVVVDIVLYIAHK